MKKKLLLALTSLFALASCAEAEEFLSNLSASEEEEQSLEDSLESDPIESVSEEDDRLDEIFLTLEDNLKPFVKSDKNGFKITPVDDDPLFKIIFKTDGELSSSSSSSSESATEEAEINEYLIELDCEESTFETFNRTKKNGYCNRMTFENAEIHVKKEDTQLIKLNQTYVGYLCQSEIDDTDPTEYENGLYVDLSKAMLSRVTFASLFDQLILPQKNYINADEFYNNVEGLFPMATTMSTILPTALDALKSEVEKGLLDLEIDSSGAVEEYKIHKSVESKEALLSDINTIIEDALESKDLDIEQEDVEDAIDSIFEYILAINGNFEIRFNENEFEEFLVDFDIELDDVDPEDLEDMDTYFSLNDLIISGKITLMDQDDVDYSTYPSNLQDHDVWKELTV